MTHQDTVFLNSEGDQWFQRNKDAIGTGVRLEKDIPLLMLSRHEECRPKRVLEVGCANGWRLAELDKRYDVQCTGVDPSDAAVQQGLEAFPHIALQRSTAADLPFVDASFDCVILSFVLHWIDRASLLRSVAEVDRVLDNDGYILISDFLPDAATRRTYHHLPDDDMYTYKQDYASLFTASHLYTQIDRIVFDHDSMNVDEHVPADDRAACTLLQKNLTTQYVAS